MWQQRRGNKFGAKKRVFNGLIYDSGKEAQYAQELELLKKAGEIKGYTRQVRFSLDWGGDKRKHICNYIADFVVEKPNGTREIREVKGFATEVFRLKWKMVEAQYGDEYDLILIKV